MGTAKIYLSQMQRDLLKAIALHPGLIAADYATPDCGKELTSATLTRLAAKNLVRRTGEYTGHGRRTFRYYPLDSEVGALNTVKDSKHKRRRTIVEPTINLPLKSGVVVVTLDEARELHKLLGQFVAQP